MHCAPRSAYCSAKLCSNAALMALVGGAADRWWSCEHIGCAERMSRIVQVANFVAPSSGGLRTALDRLAEGYSGHRYDVVQVIPGRSYTETPMAWGTRVTLRASMVPGTGYRMFSGVNAVAPTLALSIRRIKESRASSSACLPATSTRTTPSSISRTISRWFHSPSPLRKNSTKRRSIR